MGMLFSGILQQMKERVKKEQNFSGVALAGDSGEVILFSLHPDTLLIGCPRERETKRFYNFQEKRAG